MSTPLHEARKALNEVKQKASASRDEVREARARMIAEMIKSLNTLHLGHVAGLDLDDFVPLADGINAIHDNAIQAREKLAENLEKHAGGTGASAARILRAMNAAAEPVFFIGGYANKPDDMFVGAQALGGITALPGSRIELADEVDSQPFEKPAEPTTYEADRAAFAKAKAEKAALDASLRLGLVKQGSELHRDMLGSIVERLRDACDYDNETREDLARVRFGEDTAEETGTTITCPISLRGKIKAAYWLVNERGERLGKKIKRSFEVGGSDDTEDAEDAGPEYDTIDQSDIEAGDIVEWHNGDSVERWEVSCVMGVVEKGKPTVERGAVSLRGLTIRSEVFGDIFQALVLPLAGDPFILRPRS